MKNIILLFPNSRLTTLLILLAFVFGCQTRISSGLKKNERYYQNKWCLPRGGRVEVKLPESPRSRCDCVVGNYAIEFDFAKKRDEALGQAIRYAFALNKRPGVVLICRNRQDRRKYKAMKKLVRRLSKKYPVKLWGIGCRR